MNFVISLGARASSSNHENLLEPLSSRCASTHNKFAAEYVLP